MKFHIWCGEKYLAGREGKELFSVWMEQFENVIKA